MTDTTAPTVASFVAVDNAPTKASSVDYHITFSESVQDIDLSNFSLTTTGTISGASVTSVTAVPGTDGAEYIISVDTGLGTGTLNVNFNGGDASDLAGNLFAGGALAGPVGYAGSNFPQFITTADLNGDGNADLVMINSDQNNIASVLLGNGDGTFQAHHEYGGPNAGISANSVAIGDIDGDGNLDIVIASGQSATFSGHGEIDVLLGDGNGGFSIANKISAGFLSTGLTLADVNGDGKLDIVDGDVGPSSSSTNYEASVFLNQSSSGSVSFNPTVLHYNVNTSPQSTVVADFDEDGKLDLAVMNTNSPPTLAIFKGTGDPNAPFLTAPSYSIGVAGGNLFMLTGDVNNDGHADIIYGVNQSNVVHVMLGNGHGGFTTDNSYGVGNGPVGASLVDLNGDGFLDIVTSNYQANTVSVLSGNGDGTFGTAVTYSAGNQPRGIAAADFNGDGRPDIATATNGGPGAAQIFLDVPAAIPSADTLEVDRTAPALTVSLAHDNGTDGEDGLTNNPTLTGSGDFNTDVTVTVDGVDHTVTTDNNGVWSYVPTGLAGGDHTVGVSQTDEVGNTTVLQDFTFDLDTVAPAVNSFTPHNPLDTNASTVTFDIAFSEALNGLDASDFGLTTTGSLTGASVTSVDFIGTVNNGPKYTVTVNTGTGDGTLALTFDGANVTDAAGNVVFAGYASATTVDNAHSYSMLAVADINGDGFLDVVGSETSNNEFSVSLGHGDGTFAAPAVYAAGSGSAGFTRDIVLTDLNGDGKLDVVELNPDDTMLSVRLGDGNGAFGAETTFAALSNSAFLVAGDFNGDGKTDIAISGATSVSILAGDGAGSLAAPVVIGTAQNRDIVSADFNHDGFADLVTGLPNSQQTEILLSDGNGGFTQKLLSVRSLVDVVGDFNGDGNIDIAFTNGGIGVLLGNGDGTFQSPVNTQIVATGLKTADLNGDGKLDLVAYDGSTIPSQILLGKGDGTFFVASATGFNATREAGFGDFNGDGLTDLIYVDPSGALKFAAAGPQIGSATFTIDRTPPTVTISDSLNGHIAVGQTDVITFTFSEEVPNFDFVNNVKVTGGTLTNAIQVDATHYTVDFTANVSDTFGGTISVKPSGVLGSQWLDDAGNIGVSSNTLVMTGDTKAPVLTIGLKTDSGASASDYVTNNVTLTGTADPNAIVHFTLNGNPIAATAKATAAGVWTFTPTAAEGNPQFGAYVVDAAGNMTATGIAVIYDKTAPTITSITTTESGVVTSGPVHVQLHLSEGVAFSMANASTLKMSDGGIATFDAASSDDHTLDYVYTPKANEAVANLKIVSLNATGANVFADGAGNTLNITGAANKTLSGLSIDTTDSPPVVTKIAASPASTLLHTGDKVTFTITTDEKAFVTGAPVLDLDDGGHAVYTKGSGTNALTFTYTVGAGDTETSALTINDLNVIGGAITDSLGNAIVGSDIHATFANIHLDTTAPTLTHFAQNGAALTNAASVSYDIHFSEAVTGVTKSDFSLEAGAPAGAHVTGVTAIAASHGTEYTVTVATGTGSGPIVLDFSGHAAVHDLAGNSVELPSQLFQTPPTSVASTANTSYLALGDIDGDGKLDIVATHITDNDVSISLGNGDGTFQSQTTFSTGNGPTSVALGDINGDGHLDIVTTNIYDNSATVLLGDGAGGFEAQPDVPLGAGPAQLMLRDMNGDGKLDIVAANGNTNYVSVLLGNGDGSFQDQPFTLTSGPSYSIAVGDLNGDGKLDVVASDSFNNDVSILLGNGDGTLQPPTTAAVGTAPFFVALGDFNGDGKLDIVTVSGVDGNVSVLIGAGDGNFAAQVVYSVGANPGSIALADVNGDGHLDIVTSNPGNSTISVLLGIGDGTFQPQIFYGITDGGPAFVALGDVNGDGRPDILTVGDTDLSEFLANPTEFGGAFNIDHVAPTVAGVSSTAAAGTKVPLGGIGGMPVEIDVALGEAVTIHGPTSGLTLKLNDGGIATYDAAHSTAAMLAFDYTPALKQNTLDLKTTGLVLAKGTTVTDAAGNNLLLTGAANKDLGVIVDTIAPTVKSITAAPAHTGTLFTNDTVTFTVTMSEKVDAQGGLALSLSDGGTATLVGGDVSGVTSLTFAYTVGSESTTDLKVIGIDQSLGTLIDTQGHNAFTSTANFDAKTAVNVFTFKTTGDHDWHTATNWTPNADPEAGSTVIVGTSGQLATISGMDAGIASLITAKGATVDVNGADLAITHDSTNAGTLKLSGQGHNITLGTIHQPFTLNDSGTVSILAGGGGATLEILGNVTMTGAGRLALANSGADTASVASNGTDNATLTNGSATVAHSIQGSGTVGDSHLALTNAAKGVVNANVSGETLSLNPGEGANGGLMEATGGGILSLSSNFNNSIGPTQGTIQALANSTVNLDGVFIENGTFKTTNGAIHVTDASTIQNVTNTGSLVIDAAKSLELDGAVFNNKSPSGAITVNNGAMLELAGAAGALTLQGGGKIVLNGTNAQVISGGADVSVTNADNLISGFGIIGDEFFTLVNGAKGVVDATGADGLTIDTGTHHVGNAGLIEATAGSTLTIHQTDVDNLATGIISAATTGSHVVLSDAVVTGGIVSVVKGAFLDAAGGSDVISSAKVTNAGTIHVGDGDLTIIGAVTNTGNLAVDGGSHLSITGAVTGVGTATIGAGTLEFGGASSAKVTFAASVDSTLTLDAATTTAAKFTGTIAGFNAGDDIHLGAIGFVADDPTHVHFAENAAHTSAVLTVTDGSQSLTLTFLGDYTHGPSFHLQDDGTAQHHVDLVLA